MKKGGGALTWRIAVAAARSKKICFLLKKHGFHSVAGFLEFNPQDCPKRTLKPLTLFGEKFASIWRRPASADFGFPSHCYSNAKLEPRYSTPIVDAGLASAGARSVNNFEVSAQFLLKKFSVCSILGGFLSEQRPVLQSPNVNEDLGQGAEHPPGTVRPLLPQCSHVMFEKINGNVD